jgi:hypothetical protein
MGHGLPWFETRGAAALVTMRVWHRLLLTSREVISDLILRSARSCACVSKDGRESLCCPSFETHRFAMLLRMRSEIASG